MSELCTPSEYYLSDWKNYLSDTADAVEGLIDQYEWIALDEFKERTPHFEDLWHANEDWLRRDEALRRKQANAVKKRPELLKKTVRPPEEHYEWDDGYFEPFGGLEEIGGCWGPCLEDSFLGDIIEYYFYRPPDTGRLAELVGKEEIERHFVLLSCIHYAFFPDTSFVRSIWSKTFLLEYLWTWCNPKFPLGCLLSKEFGPGKTFIDISLKTVRRILKDKRLRHIAAAKHKKKKAHKAKPKNKYKPWIDPGDACFVFENNRIKFHHGGEIRDFWS